MAARVLALGLLAMGLLAANSPAQSPPAQAPPGNDVRLVGRIVSVLHEGVPAADVWVTDAAGKVLGRMVADGDGYYQFTRLPPVPLQLHARGGDKVEGSVAVATNGLVREATLMLEDGEPLRGAVVLPDGKPAAGAAVLVACKTRVLPPFDWWQETTADAKGEWSLPMAPLRPLVVRAFVPGRPIAEQDVASGRAGDVRVAILPGEIALRRVKVDGAPAGKGVRVWCDLGTDRRRYPRRLPRGAIEAEVDANGIASLYALPVPHEVRIAAAGFRSMPVCIPCDADAVRNLEFVLVPREGDDLVPRTRMTGKLVDELGQALAGVTIVGSYEGNFGPSATSGADGSYELDVPANSGVLCQIGLLSRTWRLGLPKVQLGTEGVSWLTVTADPQRPLRLDAMRGGLVRGTVLGPGGAPLAAAKVTLSPVVARDEKAPRVEKVPRVETATDAAGRLDVAGLPAGRYTVLVTRLGLPEGSAEVDVEIGRESTLPALQFAAAGEVIGIVRGADGNPMPSGVFGVGAPPKGRGAARVPWMVNNGAPVLTDRHGRYRVPGLAEGTWYVGAWTGPNELQNVRNPLSFAIEAKRSIQFDFNHTNN
ncbi:MAG TPA: carboxypeptidase-like regulatory domain-containing protein [Planctomycetota bacterium]